jgi:hypothetical protein
LQNKPLRAVARTLFGFFAQLFVQVFHLHMPKTPTCLQWHGRIYKTLTINIYIYIINYKYTYYYIQKK